MTQVDTSVQTFVPRQENDNFTSALSSNTTLNFIRSTFRNVSSALQVSATRGPIGNFEFVGANRLTVRALFQRERCRMKEMKSQEAKGTQKIVRHG